MRGGVVEMSVPIKKSAWKTPSFRQAPHAGSKRFYLLSLERKVA